MPEALGAVFPATTPQTCFVHLIRNSLDYASWKNRKAVRWLARFSVQHQTDHPAHLLRLLVDELARVERRSRQIVASMKSRTGHGRFTFKLLPELLR